MTMDMPPTPHDATLYLDTAELWEMLRRLQRVRDSVGTDWHAGHRTQRNIYKGEGADDQIGSMDNRVLGEFVGHAAKDIERLLPIAMWAKVDYDDAQRLDQMAREAHDELHKIQTTLAEVTEDRAAIQIALRDAQLKWVDTERRRRNYEIQVDQLLNVFTDILEQGSPLRDGAFRLCAYCKEEITRTNHREDCLWLRARALVGLPNR